VDARKKGNASHRPEDLGLRAADLIVSAMVDRRERAVAMQSRPNQPMLRPIFARELTRRLHNEFYRSCGPMASEDSVSNEIRPGGLPGTPIRALPMIRQSQSATDSAGRLLPKGYSPMP
jgi:hypothetical protein